jgi:hypothetical protein
MADTGSGKSTCIPAALVRHGYRVLVTTPTASSARSLSRYVKKIHPNIRIGYGAGGRALYTPQDQIVFATAGHVQRKILREGGVFGFDMVVLDEAHTVSKDYEILAALLEWYWDQDHVDFRLLISSATLDHASVKNKWSGIPDRINFTDICIPMKHVEEVFGTIDYSMTNLSAMMLDLVALIRLENKSAPPGHFLVFLPGAGDIEKLIRMLYEHEDLSNTEVFPAYSSLSDECLDRVIHPPPATNGFRSIVVATDILETSVTIPDVVVVWDSGLQKVVRSFNNGTSTKLTTVPSTRFSAIQRRGRTGRTCAGRIHYMFTLESMKKRCQTYESELGRVPIFHTVASMLHFGISPEKVLYKNRRQVCEAIQHLKQHNMVDKNLKLSRDAIFVVLLPITLNLGLTIKKTFDGTYDPSYHVGSIMFAAVVESVSCGSFFFTPRRTRGESHSEYKTRIDLYKDDMYSEFLGGSDVATHMNIFLSSLMEVFVHPKALVLKTSWIKRLSQWSVSHGVNNKKLQYAHMLYRRLQKQLKIMLPGNTVGNVEQALCNWGVQFRVKWVNGIIQGLIPSLVNIYTSNIFTEGAGNKWIAKDSTIDYRLSNRDSFHTCTSAKVLALGRFHIDKGMRTLGFLSSVIPL